MRLHVVVTIINFCTMFAITHQDEHYGEKRPLVLCRYPIGMHYHVPNFVEKETRDDHNKPYTFPGVFVRYFCPPQTDKEIQDARREDLIGCIFSSRSSYQNDKHHGEDCREPLMPLARQKRNCEVDDRKGELYEIGYKYCYIPTGGHEYKSGFLTIYNLCIDRQNEQTLYINHQFYSPGLFSPDQPMDLMEKEFSMEPTTSNYGIFEDDFKKMENAMKSYPMYPGRELLFVRTMIASSFHFTFIFLKRPMYHYSNFVLAHKGLSKLFQSIGSFIQRIARDVSEEFRIFAGLRYPSNVNEKYIPAVFFYLIFDHNEKEGIAFIVHNVAPDQTPMRLKGVSEIPCTTNNEMNFNSQLKPRNLHNHAYCADVGEVMTVFKFWPFDVGSPSTKTFKRYTTNMAYAYT